MSELHAIIGSLTELAASRRKSQIWTRHADKPYLHALRKPSEYVNRTPILYTDKSTLSPRLRTVKIIHLKKKSLKQ